MSQDRLAKLSLANTYSSLFGKENLIERTVCFPRDRSPDNFQQYNSKEYITDCVSVCGVNDTFSLELLPKFDAQLIYNSIFDAKLIFNFLEK